ncbi:hypothetical protein, partial, partial [Parasitella parasitica]
MLRNPCGFSGYLGNSHNLTPSASQKEILKQEKFLDYVLKNIISFLYIAYFSSFLAFECGGVHSVKYIHYDDLFSKKHLSFDYCVFRAFSSSENHIFKAIDIEEQSTTDNKTSRSGITHAHNIPLTSSTIITRASSQVFITFPTNGRTSMIPVSPSVATSNKRRFSKIPKSTIVPTRQSARIKARQEQLMSNRITTPSSTVAGTPSLPNTSLTNKTEVPSSLAMPSPQDLNSSSALPQWAAQIAELHHLVQRNVKLQTALHRALQRIAELEQATANSNDSLSPSTVPSVTSVQPDSTVPAASYAAVAASADSVTTTAPAHASHGNNYAKFHKDMANVHQ